MARFNHLFLKKTSIVIMKTHYKEKFMLTQELKTFREKLVTDHFEDEVKHDWDIQLRYFMGTKITHDP